MLELKLRSFDLTGTSVNEDYHIKEIKNYKALNEHCNQAIKHSVVDSLVVTMQISENEKVIKYIVSNQGIITIK